MRLRIYYSALVNCDSHIKPGMLPTDLGCLISFANEPKLLEKEGKPFWCKDGSFFMDSGAFTADSKGKPIKIEDYHAFLQKWNNECDVIAQLDAIKDYKQSMLNYDRHEAELPSEIFNKIIPVFHEGEPLEVLHSYAKKSKYIGLGGVAGFKNKRRLKAWLDRVFTEYPNPEEIGFHGFGILDIDLLKRYPWKSLDASSPAVLARYGSISTPFKPSGVCINPKMSTTQFGAGQVENEAVIRAWVESIGCNYDLAKQQDDFGTNERARISVLNFETFRDSTPKKFEHKIGYFL